MQICELDEDYPRTNSDHHSDGPTPEAKAKQILAIAPILKGQFSSQANQAAAPSHQAPNPPQQHPQSLQQQYRPPLQAQQQPHQQSDLIDFGQSDSTPATSIPIRNSSLQQTGQPPMNAPSGLQEPMQPDQPLKRVDTLTKDVDEFVDAPAPMNFT